MARSILKSDFDEAAMLKKLKKLSKSYGESQEQAVKRWGVQTCRDLAKYTQVFGSKPGMHKKTMLKDGSNVIFTHKGKAKATRTGKGYSFEINGRHSYASNDRYLRSEDEVIRWINQNRTAANRRTIKLPPAQRKVCTEALFKRAINRKYKATAGMAKDGWLDAGEQISKRQKGKNPSRIGKGLMKFSRKPVKLGSAKEGTRLFKSFADLINKLSYSKKSHVLSTSNKRKAARDGAINTLKWYKKAIKAENKKKK